MTTGRRFRTSSVRFCWIDNIRGQKLSNQASAPKRNQNKKELGFAAYVLYIFSCLENGILEHVDVDADILIYRYIYIIYLYMAMHIYIYICIYIDLLFMNIIIHFASQKQFAKHLLSKRCKIILNMYAPRFLWLIDFYLKMYTC